MSRTLESDAPTTLSSVHRPLKAAIDGVFEPRLRVSKLKLGCDADLSEATLQAYTGPVHATPYHGSAPGLSVADFLSGTRRRGRSPDQVVLIYRDGDGDDPEPQVLMRGFAEVQTYVERGSMRGSESSGSMVVSSVLKRQNKRASAQVCSRWMRDSASITAWRSAAEPLAPLGDESDLLRVDRPCTFNARGEANRHPAPITVTVGGRSERVYVFSDDDDPDAQPWTWGQALRYLLWFHLDTSTGLVGWSNLWDQTRDYISHTIEQRPASPVSEPAGYDGEPGTPSRLFQYAMLGQPSDAIFEAMTLVQAMAVVARATDTHFRVQTSRRDGAIVDDLIWWARGGGPRRELSKTYPAGDEPAEILEAHNIGHMVLSADYGDVITTPVGLGDIRRHEVTVELVPGWVPDASVDRPADVDAAVAASEVHWTSDAPQNDAWFQKYHTAGINFGANANTGRRWVLNETARYKASQYARASGYFVAGKYTPWTPAVCSLIERTFVDGGWVNTVPQWTYQPRPFRECFSADASKRSLGFVVEASFDSGVRWERLACKVLTTEAGIWIDTDDLTYIASVYDTEMHWWKAMCQDKARVRVTAVIESDRALVIVGQTGAAAVQHEASRLYDWRGRLKSNYRTSANSIYAPGGTRATAHQTVECRDDSPIMDQWLASLCDLNANRQIPGSFTIPWLECKRYQVGDCVPRVRGAVVLEGSVSGGLRRPPDIVAMIFSDTSTQIVLEDPGMAEMR